MKQSDIFSITLVASVGVVAAFFVCRAIMGDPDKARLSFTSVADGLSAKLEDPDPEIFNSQALNPTIEVFVGGCEDIDHNGILDLAELEECAAKKDEGENEGEDEGEEQPEPEE